MGGSSALEIRRCLKATFRPLPLPPELENALAMLEAGEGDADGSGVVNTILALMSSAADDRLFGHQASVPVESLDMAALLEVARCLYLEAEAVTAPVSKLVSAACSQHKSHTLKGLGTAVKIMATSPESISTPGRFELSLLLAQMLVPSLTSPVTAVFQFERESELFLPPLNWGQFRSYMFTAWIKIAENQTGSFVLFRFDGSSGTSVDAIIGQEDPENSNLRTFVMTTKLRDSLVKIKSQHQLQGFLQITPGKWHLISVAHVQPYLKKSKVTVTVDTEPQIFNQELYYPPSIGGNSQADILSSCIAFDGFQGQVSGFALYGDTSAQTEATLKIIYEAGPNHIVVHQPVRVPLSTQETHSHPLNTRLGQASCETEPLRPVWAFLASCASCLPLTPETEQICCPLVARGVTKADQVLVDVSQSDSLNEACFVRLEGKVKVIEVGTSSELWFRLGGVRWLLYTLARVIAGASPTGPCPMKHGSDASSLSRLVASFLDLLALLLKSDTINLEDMLQGHGFHVLMSILGRIPEPAMTLTNGIARSLLGVLRVALCSKPIARRAEAPTEDLLGLGDNSSNEMNLLDVLQTSEIDGMIEGDPQVQTAALQAMAQLRIWTQAAPSVQATFLEGFATLACAHPQQLRSGIGTVGLLDCAKKYITARHSSRQERLRGTETPFADSGMDRDVTKAVEDLQLVLLTMVDYDLSPSDSAPSSRKDSSADKPGQKDLDRSVSDASQQEAPTTDVGWLVACLHDCATTDHLMCSAVLWVLLQLRATSGPRFRTELWRAGFSQVAGYVLLTAPNVDLRARRDCLRLVLWQLWEHSAQNQRLRPPPQPKKGSNQPEDNSTFVGFRDDLHIMLARAIGRSVLQGQWGEHVPLEILSVINGVASGEYGEEGLPLWLGLPFYASLLQRASLTDRQSITFELVLKLKGDVQIQDELVKYTGAWITCLLQIGLCWPDVDENWQHIQADGVFDPIAVDATAIRQTCLDACIDAIACVLSHRMVVDIAGWELWQRLLGSLEYLETTQAVFPKDSVAVLRGAVLPSLSSQVLGRLTRSANEWSPVRINSLSKVILLTEEKFFQKPKKPVVYYNFDYSNEESTLLEETKVEEEAAPEDLTAWQWEIVAQIIKVSSALRESINSNQILPDPTAKVETKHLRSRTHSGVSDLLSRSFHGEIQKPEPLPEPYSLGILPTPRSREEKQIVLYKKQVTAAIMKLSQPVMRVLMNVLARTDLDQTVLVTEELCQLVMVSITSSYIEIESSTAKDLAMQTLALLRKEARNARRPEKIRAVLSSRILQLTHDLCSPLTMEENNPTNPGSSSNTSPASLSVALSLKVVSEAEDPQQALEKLEEILGFLVMDDVDPNMVFVDLFEEGLADDLAVESLNFEYAFQEELQKAADIASAKEKSRLEVSYLASDASLGRVGRHWRKLARLTEAELGLRGGDALALATIDGRPKAIGESLLGRPQFKVGGGGHEGPIMARRRPIIKLQAGRCPDLQGNHQSRGYQKTESVDDIFKEHLELANHCSGFLLDLQPETDAKVEESSELLRGWGVVSDCVENTSEMELLNEVDIEDEDDNKSINEAECKYTMNLSATFGGSGTSDLGPGLGPSLEPNTPVQAVDESVVLVLPKGNQSGTLSITKKFLYFKAHSPEHENSQITDGGVIDLVGAGHLQKQKNRRWRILWISAIYIRKYRLRNTAMEVFFRTGKNRSFFLDFGASESSTKRRDQVSRTLASLAPSAAIKEYPETKTSDLLRQHAAVVRWQRRELSTFDYLMLLNTLAGRSYNDLCQYPVFPWVLANYTSEEIDLRKEENYRDLSKPMGALNPERLKDFLERYHSFQDPSGVLPPFMYGSHYSTAVGVVLHYLVRLQPFASLHCAMQSGSFDVADRLFGSVQQAWEMCTNTHCEVKELTPEWFSLPDFLRNINQFNFGETQDGRIVDDVQLPPWAKTPEEFIRIQREALESPYVSKNLHHWIDLIFGYKQRGPAAVEANNVFFHLTYYGSVNTAAMNETDRNATELQIAHFGQCPRVLFNCPHPPRGSFTSIPRPLGMAFRQWEVEFSKRSGNTLVYVALSSPAAIVAVKVLPGKIIAVDSKGVISAFNWKWNSVPAEENTFNAQKADSYSPTHDEENSAGLSVIQDLSPFSTLPRVPLCPIQSTNLKQRHVAGHGEVPPICFSPRGGYIVTGGPLLGGGCFTLSQLDSQSSQILASLILQGHMLQISCVCMANVPMSQDGLVLVGSMDGTASLWLLKDLGSVFRQPRATRRPVQVMRGHCSSIVCCSISIAMGVCLTCSKELALLHSLEGENLLQRIELINDSGLLAYAHCGISCLGFMILCSQGADPLQQKHSFLPTQPAEHPEFSSKLEVYTVNGEKVSHLELNTSTVRSMQISMDGEYITLIGSNCIAEAFRLPNLVEAKTFDFEKEWERAGSNRSASSPLSLGDKQFTALDLGPFQHSPCIMAVGTNKGGLLVQAFPDAEQWCHLRASTVVVETPVWLVNNAKNIAQSALGKAEGIKTTAKGIAGEAYGEARSLVKGIAGDAYGQGKSLVKSLLQSIKK